MGMTMDQEPEMQVIAITPTSEARPLMEGVVEVGYLYEQFRKILAGQGTHRLFAKPVKALDEEGREAYQWMTDVSGPATSFADLDEDTQESLLRRVQVEIRELEERLRTDETLRAEDKRELLSALEKAFEIPDIAALYQVGDRPVLTQWGHLLPRWDAPQGILRRLVAERIGEAEPACVWVRTMELDGTPAPGIAVAVLDAEGVSVGTEVTDPSGVAKITGLSPGQQVRVEVAPEVSEAVAVPRMAEAGFTPDGSTASLALQRFRSVTLKVLEPGEGAPWSEAYLRVASPDEELAEGATDGGGSFVLENVPVSATKLNIRTSLPDGSEQRDEIHLDPQITEYTLYIKPKRDWKRPLAYAAASLAGLAIVGALLWAVCIFPGGPAWCQPEELVRTVEPKSELVKLPDGATDVRIDVYVESGDPGLQLFTTEGDHLAGRTISKVGLEELSESARRKLVGDVLEASSSIAERYDAGDINEGQGHDPQNLHWAEYQDTEIGFSGPVEGSEGKEVLEIKEVADQELVVLAGEDAKAMVSFVEPD